MKTEFMGINDITCTLRIRDGPLMIWGGLGPGWGSSPIFVCGCVTDPLKFKVILGMPVSKQSFLGVPLRDPEPHPSISLR